MKTHITKKRKMLLVLPLFVLPFLTLLLWATGILASGAKQEFTVQRGLNVNVPDAKIEDQTLWSKMNYYARADKDSTLMNDATLKDLRAPGMSAYAGGAWSIASSDSIAAQAYQKIEALQEVVSRPAETRVRSTRERVAREQDVSEVQRLQSLVSAANAKQEKDPELETLSQMMDKIMDIQHPERVSERTQNKQRERDRARRAVVAVSAVIPETQSIVSGSVVRLRLTDSLVIDSIVIPKHSVVNGVGRLNGERLQININSVRSGNMIVPVQISVFDLDGLEGIYVPGTINRESAKESAASAVSGIEVLSLDPTLKGQAAATGLNAAKNLFSKKARLVRMQINAGYKVLLRIALN